MTRIYQWIKITAIPASETATERDRKRVLPRPGLLLAPAVLHSTRAAAAFSGEFTEWTTLKMEKKREKKRKQPTTVCHLQSEPTCTLSRKVIKHDGIAPAKTLS